MKLPLWLWISVVLFSIGEWAALPILADITSHARNVVDGIMIIIFIVYPLFFIASLLLLPKGTRKKGVYILLIPIVVYIPLMLDLFPNL
ncbi:hypothetical protein [Alkalihalobacillus sp. AL-G]|uniref:hypothetical protein n=1 Tax=Alkalihalobacillus sp. AL-G TaxID=2926399 RepID=UPI00272D2C61|nr:hypothetical protein [Alkalihalobacillus sp. AL-G]WLD92496.1 hypothetical protein MOJ78_15970 [Alkalihalobacillus sp. AL-G]